MIVRGFTERASLPFTCDAVMSRKRVGAEEETVPLRSDVEQLDEDEWRGGDVGEHAGNDQSPREDVRRVRAVPQQGAVDAQNLAQAVPSSSVGRQTFGQEQRHRQQPESRIRIRGKRPARVSKKRGMKIPMGCVAC
jgi:hypothetical protein